ncbi:MAG: hypothetical protein MUO77_05970, partial [Anaerolineales bacterium]|nr:hypothetical protein [Anaerolineales bacterium]
MKIIVFGSSGILGRLILTQVRSQFGDESAIMSDYDRGRAESTTNSLQLKTNPRIIDVHDLSSIRSNLDHVDAAIIATKQHEPLLQHECITRGIVTVDVTVFQAFVQQVQTFHHLAQQYAVPTLVMAGYFPGLSGIAVHHLINSFDVPHEIDVSLLQHSQGSSGKYGFVDMLRILQSEIPVNTGKLKGFTAKKAFYHHDYQTEFTQYRIHSDEADILNDVFHVDVKYYTGWENKYFNHLIKFLNRTGLSHVLVNHPLGQKLASLLHPPKAYEKTHQENTSLTITGRGQCNGESVEKTVYINAKADYLATAIAATTMLRLILEKREQFKGGIFLPYQLFDLKMLKEHMLSSEIDIIGINA